MAITWTPDDEYLGVTNVEIDILYTIDITFTPAVEEIGLTFISDVSCTLDYPELSDYVFVNCSFSDLSGSIAITGNVPLDVFDRYSVEYIDHGESDKTQETVISEVVNVPDNKEVYVINVDPRQTIDVFLTVTVSLSNSTSETKSYHFMSRQTYDRIRDWTKNYFENRY